MLKSWFAVVVVLFLAAPAAAHEGHQHRYMGTISAARNDQIVLKTTDGKTMTFKLDEQTHIVKGKSAAKPEDLTVGARAVVEAEEGKQPAIARTIKLAAGKP